MDQVTLKEVTKALDTAISTTARQWFREHKRTIDDPRAAGGIIRSYHEIRKLVGGGMPVYDEWGAMLYVLWYQPSHINMAYTTALQLLEQGRSDGSTDRPLHVYDFGCGALATQFGLALAAMERVTSTRRVVDISVKSVDESVVMEAIGWRIWHAFHLEIKNESKYPHLEPLRRVCESLVFNRSVQYEGEIWLTAHHVVYQENHQEVYRNMSEIIEALKPHYVLMTTRKKKDTLLPQASAFGTHAKYSFNQVLTPLKGAFEKTNELRNVIREFLVVQAEDQLETSENSYIVPYLRNGTGWMVQQGRNPDPPVGVYYERSGRMIDDPREEDLPF